MMDSSRTPLKKYTKQELRRSEKKQVPKYPPRGPVPDHVLRKGRSVQLIIAGVVLLSFSSFELFKRLVLGTERRTQTGEINKDGTVRVFSEEERIFRDKNNWFIWIFGEK